MQFDYSLASMLPFARAAIRDHDKFSHEEFAEYLFGELEKTGVPGVVKQLPKGRLKLAKGLFLLLHFYLLFYSIVLNTSSPGVSAVVESGIAPAI
ncbi:MAG TPA: hypothetical protein VN902_17760 [Candidatus Acidoferrales bacterium]|nr:hypothetical protein [Candidatus Acidoferrales bacterium]